MIRPSLHLSALALLLLLALPGASRAPAGVATARGGTSEVLVTLGAPPLAGTPTAARPAAARVLDAQQRRFSTAVRLAIPGAQVRWRYRLVLNGAAVVVPTAAIGRLRQLPGVTGVEASTSYPVASATATRAVAGTAWRSGLPNQGAGMKIAVIDDGIDQTHPFFDPAGYTMPPGFPRGQTAYTTAKVIVARSFVPAGATWRNAAKPFDPVESGHATHVAGIAAGNAGTLATGGVRLSGVAPRAYLGNYKALTVPTDAGVGLDGNAAEIVAAIEAAVSDGMNVINLSIGEPEVEPSRDLVALALDGAAAAGVVPVVAAGNDFDEFGDGSLASPGSSAAAITVAAVSEPSAGTAATLASFSAAGPTPLSLRLKPDVSAPGVSVLSSVPGRRWEAMSGTSMATPQVSGVAALLRERHPTWTVAQIKGSLIGSGAPVRDETSVATPLRGGGGLIDPVKADVPLVLASPASVSFGLLQPGPATPARVDLSDAGGGSGVWDVAVDAIEAPAGATLAVPATVTVPGPLDLTPTIGVDAAEGDLTGYVRLTRGTDVRRIPFWLRVTRPALPGEAASPLVQVGLHSGDTRRGTAKVSRYRYPEVPPNGPVSPILLGPEQVFRVTLTKPVTNFGVVVVKRAPGVRVEPRVVAAADENRLTGYPALPVNLNPYLAAFGDRVLAAGAVRALAGTYDVVFDSPTVAGAGAYTFRFWIDDVRPPSVGIARRKVKKGTAVVASLTDAGSGIDPATIKISVDGAMRQARLRAGTVAIGTGTLARGAHRVRIQVSDYQESRNMESVPPILPNTRVYTTTITVT